MVMQRDSHRLGTSATTCGRIGLLLANLRDVTRLSTLRRLPHLRVRGER